MAGESGRDVRARITITALLAASALVAGGCGASTIASHTTTHRAPEGAVTGHSPVAPNGTPLGRISTPGTPHGEQTVPLVVVATPGRQKRSAFALVPVYINGRGPFAFALDTGASRSLISAVLARQLNLPDRGPAGQLFGIGGGATAENMLVANWRAGHVALPTEIVATLQTPQGAQSGAGVNRGGGPVGLLGSDVLSRYGKIAVDYDKGLLILDPPVK